MADDVQVGLVREALKRGSDVGEPKSRAALQGECGLGAGDLQRCLDVLAAAGEAREDAPDEWEYVSDGVGDEPAPEAAPPMSLAEAEARAAAPAPAAVFGGGVEEEREAVVVSLPPGVAGSMDEAALGGIVKAGIAEAAQAGVSFVFEVGP